MTAAIDTTTATVGNRDTVHVAYTYAGRLVTSCGAEDDYRNDTRVAAAEGYDLTDVDCPACSRHTR